MQIFIKKKKKKKGSLQEGTITVLLLVKLTGNPPKTPERKETKRKRISLRNDSNHRKIPG